MNDLLRQIAAGHPHDVAVVNLQALLCAKGPPCPYVVDGFGSPTAIRIKRSDLTGPLSAARGTVGSQVAGAADRSGH